MKLNSSGECLGPLRREVGQGERKGSVKRGRGLGLGREHGVGSRIVGARAIGSLGIKLARRCGERVE